MATRLIISLSGVSITVRPATVTSRCPSCRGGGGNTIFLAPNGLSTFVFTDYGPDSYSLAIPQLTEDLRAYPEGGVSPSPEYALVMKSVWLIPEHYRRSILINGLLMAWIGLTAGSVLLVLVHLSRSGTASRKSKIGWLFLTVLTGPIGLLLYWRWVRHRPEVSAPAVPAMR